MGGMAALLWLSLATAPANAMKGDFTRAAPTQKRYTGVKQQQGRVQTDADLNEADKSKPPARKIPRKKPQIKSKVKLPPK